MNLDKIEEYLQNFHGKELPKEIPMLLSEYKKIEVSQNNQDAAKKIWCIEQVYKIINHYINAFECLEQKKYFNAWNELDKSDIEFSFLRSHMDYSDNKFNLIFIEEYILKFQKLFPYKVFSSRESIVKKEICSICGQTIKLRNSCEHKIGEIYNGEMCFRNIEEFEFIGMALVNNPFDKFGVIFPEGMEYSYEILENIMKYLKSPYEKWELDILEEIKKEYKDKGRNEKCPCGSDKKYKKCCLVSGKDKFEHYRITFIEYPKEFEIPIIVTNTWNE